VEIGRQTWMTENLNRNIGTSWCYNNDNSYCEKYGRLYDWKTAMTACPDGYRLPNIYSWSILAKTVVGDASEVGKKLKSSQGWYKGGNGTNEYVFSALPGGFRSTKANSFLGVGGYAVWWTASEDGDERAILTLMSHDSSLIMFEKENKNDGYSVRCVKD